MRYLSLKNYLTGRFKRPVAKVALDAGLTCPNRDGYISGRGCLFCDESGAGTGASARGRNLRDQLEQGMAGASRRASAFIAYFQAYTNTYASVPVLESFWDIAVAPDPVVVLSVGTRPDCVPDPVLDLLASYTDRVDVWLELGLQSTSDRTLRLINRGHDVAAFRDACRRAKARGLMIIAHVIFGLPGDAGPYHLRAADLLTELGVDGVKIHSLYVTPGAGIERLLDRGGYELMTREEYVDRVVDFLSHIPADMVIHRLTGDPPRGIVARPDWTMEKGKTIEMIRSRLAASDTWQGKALGYSKPDLA